MFFTERLKQVLEIFQIEIHYYTDPKMSVTSHAVGEADPQSYTKILFENNVINALPLDGGKFIELERTIVSLACLFQILEHNYEAFTISQKVEEKISQEHFFELSFRIQEILDRNSDNQLLLIYLIIYSDLGKSSQFRQLVADLAAKTNKNINISLDSDDLMTECLTLFTADEISVILPSFAKLSLGVKEKLKAIYPIMRACFGHIYFLERGQKTFDIIAGALEKISLDRQIEALNLVYLAQLCDGFGAQGQKDMRGSVTCTDNFYKGYRLMDQALQYVHQSMERAFEYYLYERAAWLGFADKPLTPRKQLLTRLGCQLRGFTPEMGGLLTKVFDGLDSCDQELLIVQLGFNQESLEGWTKVNYIATVPQNLSRALFEVGKINEAMILALNGAICFAKLIESLRRRFPGKINNEKISISFGEIASLATKSPEIFNPKIFNVEDYYLDITTNKVMKLPILASQLACPFVAFPPVSVASIHSLTSSAAMNSTI